MKKTSHLLLNAKKNESRAADDLEKPVSPLQSAVKNTASTLPSPLPKTVAYYDFDDAIPPVGWLVCVKGTYIGHAFECRTGRNRIGRNPDLDISLTEDKSISREPHAILIYEPKERKFFIQAGSSDGLVYHNGSLLFGHQELSLYDRISLGKAEFIFLPLCGNQFTWDDYMPEG